MILGDCLDVLPTLPAGSVHACITDPPYGIGAPGTDDWDRRPPPPAAWSEVRRVLAPGAGLAVMTARRYYHAVATALEDRGCTVSDMLVWLYASGRSSGRHRLRAAHDPIVLAVSGPGPLRLDVEAGRIPVTGHDGPGRWPTTVAHDGSEAVAESLPTRPASPARDRSARDCYGEALRRGGLAGRGWHDSPRVSPVVGYGDPAGSVARYFYCGAPPGGAARRHPTEKPLPLMRWLIRMLTGPGDVVLDPWAGGGTTALAARAEGRGYVAIEREPQYHARAVAALSERA